MTHLEFLSRVSDTISSRHLLPPPTEGKGPAVLVALSGGADSVALLRALLELGYPCEAAHCNFRLRGAESDRDELFVQDLCQRLGIALHRRSFDTRAYAAAHHLSIEMAARELRYDFFRELTDQRPEMRVAVAHHRDDNAETVLLNLARGTGLRGLSGIPYQNGNIVRPLLDVGQQDIATYLQSLGQPHVEDSTNAVPDVKRNKVRLQLMPLLRELNPSIAETLHADANRVREAQDFIASRARNIYKVADHHGNIAISKADIDHQVLLFELLRPYGFTPDQIGDIWRSLDGQPGAVWHSPSHTLLRDRENIVIRPTNFNSQISNFKDLLSIRVAGIEEVAEISRSKDVAILDADKVGEIVEVRLAREGDRFVPYGMAGSKLVSRYMIDHKLSAFEKERQLVVCNGAGIVWLAGQRIDDRYKIVPGQTRRVLILSLKSDKS